MLLWPARKFSIHGYGKETAKKFTFTKREKQRDRQTEKEKKELERDSKEE